MLNSPSKLLKLLSGFASIFVFFAFLLTFSNSATAQTSTEFWFAPPEVSQGHAGSVPIYLRLAAGAVPATVTIEMPANAAAFNGGSPIVVNIPANGSYTETLSAFVNILETRPTGVVRNTGLKITSTADITAIYEVSPGNNPDIWALKGLNGLGTEFYTPFQNIWPNGGYTPTPYTSFDIVATEDNTTILIYPTADLDGGQPAFQSFTITLNEGETYSGSVTDPANPINNPTGSQIISDKPIAVSIKDDSINPTGYGGCRDLNGDQLVPVNIVGDEYIVNKGALNSDDLAMVVATQNNTVIEVDGVVVATLFNGETYRIQISNALTYITGSKPFYLIHVSGFGCETGTALLPPLNCAGSEQVSFVRSTGESFFINLLVPAGNEDAFVLNGNATIIDPGVFNVVPGTGGYWVGAQIQFNTTQIPVGTANLLVNTEEVFSMGLINGGASSGCRFGYFSQFSAEIIVDAGVDQTVCANRITQLAGDITGGATNGVWTSNGTGSFSPDEFALDAIYEPTPADLSAGSVTLTLTSVSNCFPVEDEVEITYTPAPIVDAGLAITACENNTVVTLNGYVDVASGAIWSGGAGTYSPHSGVLSATYTPSAAEVTNGSVQLYLTSTGNGNCFAEIDSVLITFGPPPTANAGADQTLCQNNNVAQLNGAVTIAGGGEWSSPTGGSFLPSNQSLTPTYTPSNSDLITGSVTITFTTTNNSGCSAVADQMVITYTDAPEVDAASDRTVCKNNADVILNGSVVNATGGTWTTGGSGTFAPDANTLNATYTPSLNDKLNGSVSLTLTSTGNGDCIAESDVMIISFTDAPTVNAGVDGSVCSNNSAITLNGSLTIATIGIWSTTTGGSFNNSTNLNAIYTPSATDISNGSVTLTLESLDNGTCSAVTDDVTYTFTAPPTANAGLDRDICENNAAITLNGSVTLAGGGAWSGGSGSYSPDNTTLNAVYTPTPSEISSGSVTLTLSTTANGTCSPVTDQVVFTFTDAPTANAGTNKIVCANNAAVDLTGLVTIASGGTWSGGLGTYSPNANSLTTTYSPTTTEINSGSLTLTLTTTGNGTCSAETDDVLITFTPAPTAEAGIPISVCSNNAQVSLGGSVTVAGGGTWSGGAGTYSPNANSLIALYNPTAAEIASGSLILTLTTTGNGTCTQVQDVVSISFTPAPTANAGADVTVCNNNAVVDLNGSIIGASGGTWSGGSGSFNPNNTTLGASYTPSNAELSNGTVTLTLTTSGNGNCNAVTDQITITITPPPTVNAGADDVYCANNPAISLNGAVTVASGATWSGGSGSFNPNASALNATYTPSQSEINNGSLILTLTSTGNSNCVAVTDQVTYTFSPAPTVEAGINQSLCANNSVASLSGVVTIATGGTWSGGIGSFANANALNTTYTPNATEITAGSVKLYLTSTSNGDCNAVTDSLTLSFTPAPTANANADRTVCANAPDVTLNGAVTVATGGTWSGGTGSFSTNANDLSATYTPSAAEITAGTVTLTLTTTGNANCNQVTDQMIITITPAPIVNAGADAEFCANNSAITLGGSVTTATGGTWSGGSGSFAPNANDLGAVYTPNQSELNAGTLTLTLTSTGNGSCVVVTDDVTYTFSPAPTADAGTDQSLCSNNAVASLTGVITVATGGTWTSNGTGAFGNASALTTSYTPSPADITSGTVTLTLTTTGNDDCNAVTDAVVLTFTPAPTANAGTDRTVCANDSEVTLSGLISTATGGTWSGGSGTFTPDANTLNATYTPSAADITAGLVTLTLTTTGNGTCNQVTDQMAITITPAPTVNAGIDEEFCANNAAIALGGSITTASGATWSGGNGTFAPNANDLNAVYSPSQAEINAGTLTLTLTSTGNGSCVPVTDNVTYTFSPAPTVNAGADQILCANNAEAAITGVITIATGGTWSGGAGNFSPSANSLSAFYTPTPEEITAGTVTLKLTSTGNSDCNAVADSLKITFTPAPIANAGLDRTVCANAADVTLNGSISVATGGTWTGGSGTFAPDANTLNAVYAPSADDITNGTVTLTLTTTGNGTCIQVTNQMVITITPEPTVEAGTGTEYCSNNAAISLNGAVTTATGGIWSGGNGTYAPNANTLNAVYSPSQAEINSGSITLTLTSSGNGSCVSVNDAVTFTFGPAPTANAGANQSLCANNAVVELTGSVTVATGGTWSGGAGTFLNANALNTFYTPTAAEITAGTVTLTLTTTGNDDCSAVSDDIVINFTPAPTSNAGTDKTVCANDPEVNLNGSVSIATGGTWSGGSGTFTPDANALNAIYTPSAADISAGTVTLALTTTGNANCNQVIDQMVITITPAPVVDAGIGSELCANNAVISLNGSVTGATGGTWSGGTGTFSPNANTLNASYTPSQGEINSTSLTLTLTSTGNGLCLSVNDAVTYTFSPAPTVNAGIDQTLCANNSVATLSGAVTVATGGTWTGGAGTFANANALSTSYTPTAGEIAVGSVTLTLTTTGNDDCNAVADSLKLTFTPAPVANAGTDKTVCANNVEVNLNGNVSVATGGIWSGGNGTFDPSNTALSAVYTPSAAEIAAGQVTLTLTTSGNGNCVPESDNVLITINPEPIVNAGTDLTICSNNATFNLNGSVTNAAGGQWSGGLGVYSGGNTNLSATYTPTLPEIVAGSVTFTLTSTGNAGCIAVTDQMVVTFTPSPTVNAGTDITLCASAPVATLNGNFTVSGGAQWSGGNGTYSPNALAMNATYTPTAAELASGSVTLTLTTISNGNCLAESDVVVINYDPQPTVNAGANLVSCANNSGVALNGSFTNASGVEWSGGMGFYDPSNEDPSANYTPSNAEIINGGVTLTLTSVGSGACADVTDNVTITINPAPIVAAGDDKTICANNNLVQLNGTIQFAGGGQWSGGSGTFSPSANALSATYQPSAADLSAGLVTLTLSSTGIGTCNVVTDQLVITFTPAPIADAGTDITACENNATVQLSGSFTVAEGANWSGGTGSFNPNASTMNAQYTPSQSELNNGSVTLTLTTFGNGNCLQASDQVVINFTPAPEVDAGEDYFVCVDELIVPLEGQVSGPTNTGIWTTSGTGVFVPNASVLNGTYQVSSADSLAGVITLTLTSSSNGLCTPVTDEILVYISPAGTANAGADQAICKNNPNIAVTGVIGGAATSGTWLTSGTGVFTPNANQPLVNYIPSTADLAAGNVTLTFAVNSCNQATDDVIITFTPSPVVAAGADITVCSSESDVQLLGSVSGASATGLWTSSGSGNFIPNANTLNATYEFSADDADDQIITLILKATDIGNCINVSDTLTLNIFPEGTANAGADVIACDNNPEVQLAGVLTGADQALWTTSGTGTFAPNAQTLNATYVPSAGDLVNGSVNLILAGVNSCNNATDFMNISFTDGPEVQAGPDQAACGDVFPFQVTGTFANSTGAQWSTSGTGTFQNANNPNTFYVASQNDIDQGGVFLMLTSTGNGNCFPVTDSLLISISSGVTVEAGEDRSACVDAGTIQLYGNISNGSTTGTWTTSGNGTFSPNANAINAVYNFTQQDIDAGSLTLTLTSTNNGICNPASDNFELTFGTAAYVFAGSNINECVTIDLVELHGIVSSETNTGVWSTAGDGTFFPNIVALDAFYEPGPNDLSNGDVEITLTSTNSALCSETNSTLTVNFQSLPVADAAANQVICGDIEAVQMLGNVQGATGGIWSTAGSGTFFPNDSVLTALYTPSSADSLNGSVTLTLTTYGNGACGGDMDQMQILFSGAVTAIAGSDQNVCIDEDVVSLAGAVEGSDAYQWGTMGTGSFVPSSANLTTNYEPSEADKALGSVTLYLQAAGTGNCPSDTDSLNVTFDALPVIVTQANVESCVTSDEVALASDVSGAASVLWQSNGGGTFSPNANVQDVVYLPTAGEIASGNTMVTISAISGNACGTLTESVTISFRQTAVVNAGADMVACETDGAITLSGAVSGAGYEGQWSTNAFGSFSPVATQLDADYTFGNNDILIGSARLILTSTNNGACPAVSDTVEVAINRQATANAGADDFVCKSSGMVAMNGTAQFAESTMWTTLGDGVFLPSGEELDTEYVIGNADGNSGSVNLILTATALAGCADKSDTVTVNISNPLAAGFSQGNACAESTIQFVDETEVFAGSISSWRWDFGNGNISNQQNPQFVYSTPGSRSVELVVSSTLGCNDTIVQLVNVVEGPKASFEISDNPAPINFDVRFTDTSVGAQSWDWAFGDVIGFSNIQNPTHEYITDGNYDVTLVVTGESGCTDTSRTTIVIEGFLVLPPRLPNTFSPNGDGINDVYLVRGGPFTELEFTVYDGWGSKIFKTTDQNIGWDGTEGGKQSPVGVYVYTVRATNLTGDDFDYSGKINLIR
ncbi:T9SS type B sorting domain-containing protein [Cryomorpha ignava]|uniref:T9SS type B sorting domain-containing protein n=1 Tax=Cryomorpha ignava TaxID=101383 RepID=A0A7K3WR29_9FLAO|nr:PKD domain-containing protein [Cryomorpha ignava]NEN24133.1 T9SS type B sorting domain-containing protein [Cryomorpha ignava]